MTRKHQLRQAARRVQHQTDTARASQKAFVGDSFQNLAARVGLGAGSQADASRYSFDLVTRNRVQMEAVYRSSWIAGMAVDAVAQDMTRAGIEMQSEMEPADQERLERAMGRLRIWDQLCETIKWSRLYGGAVAVLMIDGQSPETPLRLDTISKGQFKGLLVLDRWLVQPSLENLVTDYGPDLGKPKYYSVVADAMALMGQRIHHTRLIRIDGVRLPYWQRIAENGWGQSVLERLWDRLVAFDSTTQGAAQLVYKAHLRTYKVEKLRELIATGGRAFEALVKQIEMIRLYQSNEGMTLMDASDTFEAHQYSFGGLSDLMLQFAQQVSGALGIPMIRLFGQAPVGLGGDHSGEMRNYYDSVNQDQETNLRPGMATLLDVLSRSELGRPLPEGFDFTFRPLWQLSDTEKAEIASKVTAAVSDAYDGQLVDRATVLKELRQNSHVTGIWSNITDEDIEQAKNDPPPGAGELGLNEEGGNDPANANKGPAPAEVITGQNGQD
ncbi:DUF1073 domain-containing protein [Chromobacterium subtsugae]|uniref:DUF1073 domain-containing protein n=1 Tax=Chromobacterium subtsugae TaxID=251747 RepID=UPI0009B5B0E7|nr:DUF1073 domain-containing protein [Chromobacterium subtsugae]